MEIEGYKLQWRSKIAGSTVSRELALLKLRPEYGIAHGEIFSLRWSNVDLRKGILAVFASKTQTI
jgi:integrase